MNVLRKGYVGRSVAELQGMLNKQGYPTQADGIFGQQTYIAVCKLQQKCGLTVDGVVGKDTWNIIRGSKALSVSPAKTPVSVSAKIPATSELNYTETAILLGVEEAAIRAVSEVESGGRNGFLSDARPMILFEGHIFWRQLIKQHINPEDYKDEYKDVLFQKWDKTSYKGGAAEYERLNKAASINEEAALCSASWGMFQIMGFNYKACGYDTVQQFVADIKSDSNKHLLSFANFIKYNTDMHKALQNFDWARFAEKYNGPGYKQNRYDEKLQNAYLKYKKQLSNKTINV